MVFAKIIIILIIKCYDYYFKAAFVQDLALIPHKQVTSQIPENSDSNKKITLRLKVIGYIILTGMLTCQHFIYNYYILVCMMSVFTLKCFCRVKILIK